MAELFIAQGWTPPSSIAMRLREDLPQGVCVVVGSTLAGHEFDVIVVSEYGLIVVYLLETRAGSPQPHRSFVEENIQRSEQVLDGFMHDEFPTLHPTVRHLTVGNDGGVVGEELDRLNLGGMMVASAPSETQMVDAILGAFDLDPAQTLDWNQRSELAQALCERRLTVGQRASVPFVFRTGDFLGRGKTVWTILDAILHMDRHPDDGIYHLRNGTFVRWLQEQGAGQVAAMANDALQTAAASPREMLELFLIDTGRVERPSMVLRPKTVDLGPIQVGTQGLGHLQIRQVRGRGYLFGQLATVEPWIKVTPSTFGGSRTVVSINVDTGSLPIDSRPQKTYINITSSADASILKVPISFQVVGTIPSVQRLFLRPIAALLIAGTMGMLIGWLLGRTHPLASLGLWPASGIESAVSEALLLAILVGIFWALLGAVIGFQMPDTWSFFNVTKHWLSRSLLWMVGLFAVTTGACVGISRFVEAVPAVSVERCVEIGLVATAFALAPIAFGGLPVTRDPVASAQPKQALLGRHNLIAVGMLLLAAVIAFAGFRELDSLAGLKDGAQKGAEARLAGLDTQLQHWSDDLRIRYYDRRAPSRAGIEPGLQPVVGTDQMTVTVVLGSAPTPPLGPIFP